MAHVGSFNYPVLFERDLRLYEWNGFQFGKTYTITPFGPPGTWDRFEQWKGVTVQSAVGVVDYDVPSIDWDFLLPGDPYGTKIRIHYVIENLGQPWRFDTIFFQPGFTTLTRQYANNLSGDGRFRGSGDWQYTPAGSTNQFLNISDAIATPW